MDRLRDRLVHQPEPTPEDLRALSLIEDEYAVALDAVVDRVGHTLSAGSFPDVRITKRLKTVNTLLDKLRRGAGLSRVQDIAGVRIVGLFDLDGQDAIVGALTDQFVGTRVVDRRTQPSTGYRAVHALVHWDGFAVEVQVRTPFQHVWAGTTERLADAWGRAIRYGGPPEGVNPETVARRRRMLDHWLAVSERVATLERAEVAANADLVIQAANVQFTGDPEDALRQLRREDSPYWAPLHQAMMRLGEEIRAAGPEIGAEMRVVLEEVSRMLSDEGVS